MIEGRLSSETSQQITPAYDTRYQTKEFIEIVARALVDEPERVFVSEVGGMHTSILELKVAKADIGKIIGKQGRTARSLRTILGAASAKVRKRIVLEIVE